MIAATVEDPVDGHIVNGATLNASDLDDTTIEWFGATTYRLRACGLTIFLDTWLERPKILPSYLAIEDVAHVDYIFISHAHFDHLPGCDRLAKRTGATIIANGEAINALRGAGVPEDQLVPVSGGERVPLFTNSVRRAARKGQCATAPGPPGAPVLPDPSLAVMSVHVWPSLHCLLPGTSHADIPDTMDTATTYTGGSQYACTIDITRGMRYGLLRLGEIVPPEHLDDGQRSFIEYVSDRKTNLMSNFDGGQMAFSFQIGDKTLMWNSHLGGYSGILQNLAPKPDVLILSVAGRANIDGRAFDGSAAEAATQITRWLGEPSQVIFCLYDEAPIKPWRVDTQAAKQMIEAETRSQVRHLQPAKQYTLFCEQR